MNPEDTEHPFSTIPERTVEQIVPEVKHVTAEVVDLKLRALRSDLRLMILASVALNQFLHHLQIPNAVSVPAVLVAVFLPFAKTVLFRG